MLYFMSIHYPHLSPIFFFFNDTATTEIYTLSLHDALPISSQKLGLAAVVIFAISHLLPAYGDSSGFECFGIDRKSTRLNSSHGYISYAVFCLKKKKKSAIIYLLSIYTREVVFWMDYCLQPH